MIYIIVGMLIAPLLISIGITVALTAVLFRLVGSPSQAALIGGLTPPLLAIGWISFELATQGGEGGGGLLLLSYLAVMTTLTLKTGSLMAARRNRRNGN